MTQLDPKDYLEAYRSVQAPRPTTLDAVYVRLEAELGPGSGPLGGGGTAAASGAGVKVIVGLAAAAGLGLVFLASATPSPPVEPALAAAAHLAQSGETGDQEGHSPLSPEPLAAQPPDHSPEAPASAPPSTIAATPVSSPIPPRSRHDRGQPESAPAQASKGTSGEPTQGRSDGPTEGPTDDRTRSASDLAADLRGIKRIRVDVIAGRYADALEGIEHHRVQYPDSSLAKERTVLELEARCGGEGGSGARAEARRFLANNPMSTMAQRVRAACGLED